MSQAFVKETMSIGWRNKKLIW